MSWKFLVQYKHTMHYKYSLEIFKNERERERARDYYCVIYCYLFIIYTHTHTYIHTYICTRIYNYIFYLNKKCVCVYMCIHSYKKYSLLLYILIFNIVYIFIVCFFAHSHSDIKMKQKFTEIKRYHSHHWMHCKCSHSWKFHCKAIYRSGQLLNLIFYLCNVTFIQ